MAAPTSNELAMERTVLARERTEIAAERTGVSQIRTVHRADVRWLLVLALFACACKESPPKVVRVETRTSQIPRRSASVDRDPLPSWRDSASRRAIVTFVERVSTKGSRDYVPVEQRIAVFDNDGTLWVEQPMYTQLAFTLDRVRELAPQHPEWRTQLPFSAILVGNVDALARSGEQGIAEVLAATHAHTTTEEFEHVVTEWAARAKHPTLHRPYPELVYAPMLELLAYLRANEFTTFIVSGGGVEFMRPWAERVYGVPRWQIIGSRVKLRYEHRDGVPVLARQAAIELVDDKAGKPVGIQEMIGRRPIAAFGNSDGDFEMLEWTTSGPGPRLGMIVHHTDAEREFAYDRQSPFGQLVRALDEAEQRGWVVVDMKQDWKRIFR